MRDSYNVLYADNLVAREVNNISADLAGAESLNDSSAVNELAACEVEYLYAVLAERDGVLVYGVLGVVVEGKVQRDIIRLRIDVVDISCYLNLRLEVQSRVYRQERIVADNVHAERDSDIGKLAADSAETDKTEGLAHDLSAREIALAFFNELAYLVALTLKGLSPLDSLGNLSRSEKKSAYRKLLNGVGVCAGGVEYYDALLRALVNGDIVYAGARSCDSKKLLAELHVVHLSRAYHYSGGVLYRVAYGVSRLVENVGAAGCDLIQSKNIVHFKTRPFVIYDSADRYRPALSSGFVSVSYDIVYDAYPAEQAVEYSPADRMPLDEAYNDSKAAAERQTALYGLLHYLCTAVLFDHNSVFAHEYHSLVRDTVIFWYPYHI